MLQHLGILSLHLLLCNEVPALVHVGGQRLTGLHHANHVHRIEMRGLRKHIPVVLTKLHGLHDLGSHRPCVDARRHAHPKGAASGLALVAHHAHQPHGPGQLSLKPSHIARVTRHALHLKPRHDSLGTRLHFSEQGLPFLRPGAGLRHQRLGPQLPQFSSGGRRSVVDVAHHKHGCAHLFQERQQCAVASRPLERCTTLGLHPRPFLVKNRHVGG